MLLELRVVDLGVIESLSVVLGPGMTAVTGETGAGKTLLVEAIALLMGERADAAMVRPGAAEAVVEGRFELDGTDVVLRRVVPASGRSRAYRDGAMCTVASLADVGAALVDLHGQHAHQSLLRREAQRRSLDRFADIDTAPLAEARQAVLTFDEQLASLGGDARQRARAVELLAYQLDEIEAAAITGADEDARLAEREAVLGEAAAHREAAAAAVTALGDGALEALGDVQGALGDRAPFTDLAARLTGVVAEVEDLRSELRARTEGLEEDPETLGEVRARRRQLRELMRKYGDDLAAVLRFAEELSAERAELLRHDQRVAELEDGRAEAAARHDELAHAVGAARRAAAPRLAGEIEANLRTLALPHARVEVAVDGDAGEEVEIRLATNPDAPVLPLGKVASGGELSRTMLALRLVLSDAPPTLVFDEVDAGIGGETGAVLGRQLARLADHHQVLVVTHLPQVAACADHHLVVTKSTDDGRTATALAPVEGTARQAEIARMLSGSPSSASALEHARELLGA